MSSVIVVLSYSFTVLWKTTLRDPQLIFAFHPSQTAENTVQIPCSMVGQTILPAVKHDRAGVANLFGVANLYDIASYRHEVVDIHASA
jgi:hypothetical protein